MNDPKRGPAEALKVARYFGAEYQANPGGDTRSDYYDSIAWYYGIDNEENAWRQVPLGVERERKLQRRG